ncbi:DUF2637 domain-containing protein [Streptomyces sp. NPDC101393]|uniref:DUF2637 domain-containing protein n=1 Tax=Streptomyces sp. NPDC101393 TaxID=3366141 RepID=UPI00382710AB
MNTRKAENAALYVAVSVIVALTGVAFWLSYAHLADVAGQYGLGGSAARQWVWPGTLDLFIVAGEVLMFRSTLRKKTDAWAIFLTVVGSVGSIALNVAGVGAGARFLDYVVAAVPPTAALLAFGALMRQVHTVVTATADTDVPVTAEAPATVVVMDAEHTLTDADMATGAATEPDTDMDMDTAWDDALADMTAPRRTPPAQELATARADWDRELTAVEQTAPPARTSTSRGRTDEEIQAVIDYLHASGSDVNGSTYAAHVGNISTRTGRRDLSRVGITG